MYYRTRSRKGTILLVALILLAAGGLYIGSTFAYPGVDRNGTAEQTARDFQVAYEYTTNVFDPAAQYIPMAGNKPFSADTLWCPGRTEIITLRIDNNEDFPVECTLKMDVSHTDFDDVLTYAVMNGRLSTEANPPRNWNEFVALAGQETVLSAGEHTLQHQALLWPDNGNEKYITLAIHMDEGASSKYASTAENPVTLAMTLNLVIDADMAPGQTYPPQDQLNLQ